MKIGIIIYSETNHTLSVAEKIKIELEKKGNNVTLEKITVKDKNTRLELENIPTIKDYDVVILGSPVQGFTLAMPMKNYLKQLPSLLNKKIGIIITESLKNPYFGGNRSVRKITKACINNGASIYASAIVHWSAKNREQQIEQAVKTLTNF
jgi:flavodoxin